MTMTMTADAAEPDKKPQTQRERGTLKDTLPRTPIVLITLVCTISAALATALFVYSYSSPTTTNDVVQLGFIAFLGSISTAVGIIFGDSLSHVFAFGVALVFVDHGNIKSSIIAASPSLMLAALSSIKGPREIMSSLDSSFLTKSITLQLQAICIAPFLALVYQLVVNPVYLNFSSIPICSVSFVTLLLMYAYNKNRSHKDGYLLTSEMQSQALFAGIAMLLSCSIAMDNNAGTSAHTLIVFLLGSLFTLLMSYAFASVADVWYTIGSGQFQMVSLDTAGMMIYFVCPAVVLHLRFLDKYGDSIASKCTMLREYLQSTGLMPSGDMYGEDVITFSLVLTLAMIVSVGVPLLNALCPMGGYLFARAYTHGQPNTKKVALCINFSDLPKDSVKLSNILESLEKKKTEGQTTAVLNIFATLEDLTLFPAELKFLASKGHAISLVPSQYEEAVCGLSIFQGNKASGNLQFAHHEYCQVFEKDPSWVLSKSADCVSRHPYLFREAKDLGMKVAYWSIHVPLTGDVLTSGKKSAIMGECACHDGGSIVYAALKKGVSSNIVSTSLCDLIDTLEVGFSLESLSDVARDDATMVL